MTHEERKRRFNNLCNEIDISPAQQAALEQFIENLIKQKEQEMKQMALNLITEEIADAHTEGTPTSRLTSLYNKLSALNEI